MSAILIVAVVVARRSSISCEEISLDQQNEKMPEAFPIMWEAVP